ncbi:MULTISPECIES: 5'-nucleotidase [Ramlibacter]|uniref:5'-nucleotidase n=1 Tax=Ramlibacter aquaticus TaxID=2780094 RepID=A0ABR9SEV1_9BURK|nr:MULTISPECIES: 5'-nucleotidase [Ramlibacter]MBE7940885.1 5'-nucleotidase [Ramlibacter aquaticus]
MATTLDDKLVVAISSRALFNFEEENSIFEGGDPQAYMRTQLERLDEPARPGIAFSLIKKLLAFNDTTTQRVEVVILSRNDPVSGMRVFRSGEANAIHLLRGVFTQGSPPFRYLRPLRAHLFLSANAEDVREALAAGFPAARVLTESVLAASQHPHEVRIAFDGDAVLFSDEAEQVFQAEGLDAFQAHETRHASRPLPDGPFKPFLSALHRLQQAGTPAMRLRTALVTARSAPAHERAIRTLMHWGIRVDEAMFLGGLPKGEFLREFEPDFFFDDQTRHVSHAAEHGVPAGHVAAGVANAKP